MLDQLPQFLITGVTVGSIYALVGLGFAIIYNASDVVNFAQGEFVMIGAMMAISLLSAGAPFLVALVLAALGTVAVGLALEKFAVEPARGASVVTLIIITIGVTIVLRAGALAVWGADPHVLPAFSTLALEDHILRLGGITVQAQSLWIWGATAAVLAPVYAALLTEPAAVHRLVGKCARLRLPEQRVDEMVRAGLLHLDLVAYGLEPGGALAARLGSRRHVPPRGIHAQTAPADPLRVH